MPVVTKKLTLTLGTTSLVIDRFLEYTPRIEIQDQRSSVRHTVNQNLVLMAPVGEGKQLINFTAIGELDLYTGLSKLYSKQNAAIRAGTFQGIEVIDEIDKFVEFALTPTRASVGAFMADPDGAIQYYAKFLMHLVFDPRYSGIKHSAACTLTELAKLPP